jgi:hypothetical protein
MSAASRVFVAVLLLSMLAIEFGGYFLLMILSGKEKRFDRNSVTVSLFRAGHAHAGVLVVFAIAAMPYIDLLGVSDVVKMIIRICLGLAPILVSAGMFGAGGRPRRNGAPGPLVALIYAGAGALAIALVLLGVSLLRV